LTRKDCDVLIDTFIGALNKGVHYEQTILYIERENEIRCYKKSGWENKNLT